MHFRRVRRVWEEALIWGWVVVEIGGEGGSATGRVQALRAACAGEVEGALKPLPRFIRDLIVWE